MAVSKHFVDTVHDMKTNVLHMQQFRQAFTLQSLWYVPPRARLVLCAIIILLTVKIRYILRVVKEVCITVRVIKTLADSCCIHLTH